MEDLIHRPTFGQFIDQLFQVADFARRGSVGEIAGNYLDGTGGLTAHPMAELVVKPRLDDVRSIPWLVLAAGGKHNVPLIRAGILAQLCHVLITDEDAARELVG